MFEFVKRAIKDRLATRLTLSKSADVPDPLWFSRLVVPFTSVDDLLKTVDIKTSTLSIAATSDKVFFTIGPTERWLLYGVWLTDASGVYTFSRIGIGDPDSHEISIIEISPSAGSKLSWLSNPLVLDRNWYIYAKCDAYTSTGNALMRIYIQVEDAY